MFSFHVHIQSTMQCKSHTTKLALFVSDLLVNISDMILQRLFVDKGIVALVALVDDSLVFGSLMLLQFVIVKVFGIALIAIERFALMFGFEMSMECFLRGVHIFAMSAGEPLVSVMNNDMLF